MIYLLSIHTASKAHKYNSSIKRLEKHYIVYIHLYILCKLIVFNSSTDLLIKYTYCPSLVTLVLRNVIFASPSLQLYST